MRKDAQNPPKNELPSECKEEALISAIEQSGYPLQGEVAYKLKNHFHLIEEWGYFDKSVDMHRSLDIFEHRQSYNDNQNAVRPSCSVLVECKRSKYPYVFFSRSTEQIIDGFPAVAHVGPVDISDRSGTSRSFFVSRVLGVDEDAFVSGAQMCNTFARGIRKGRDIELSGTDPFNSIILPLARAVDHVTKDRKKATQRYFQGWFFRLVFLMLRLYSSKRQIKLLIRC